MSRVPPVRCSANGCTVTHPGDKFASIRAKDAGWFHRRDGSEAFCPEHLPDWVVSWRARKQNVRRTFTRLPSVTECQGCGFSEVVEDTTPEALSDQGARAGDHVTQTGHPVTVGTSQVLLLQAVAAPADREPAGNSTL
jgi:hypothetical protein